jgi:hypothetical protein
MDDLNSSVGCMTHCLVESSSCWLSGRDGMEASMVSWDPTTGRLSWIGIAESSLPTNINPEVRPAQTPSACCMQPLTPSPPPPPTMSLRTLTPPLPHSSAHVFSTPRQQRWTSATVSNLASRTSRRLLVLLVYCRGEKMSNHAVPIGTRPRVCAWCGSGVWLACGQRMDGLMDRHHHQWHA